MELVVNSEVSWFRLASSNLQLVHLPLIVGHQLVLFFDTSCILFVRRHFRMAVQLPRDILEDLLVCFPLEVVMRHQWLRIYRVRGRNHVACICCS